MNNFYNINFSLVNELISQTFLIYNCKKHTILKKRQNSFVVNILNIETLKISNTQKIILRDLFNLNGDTNFDINKFFNINGIQVAIILNHQYKNINIIFSGQDNFLDLLNPKHTFKKQIKNNLSVKNIKVHNGFFNLLFKNNLYNDLLNEIKKIKILYPEYKINITGHSIGGAIATLFGYFLSYSIQAKIYIFSFGSPRVGNKKWANIFNSKNNLEHYRFVNFNDIISVIPHFNYCHCGNKFLIKKNCYIDFINKIDYKDTNSIINNHSIKQNKIEKYYENFNSCYNIKI